MTFDLSKPYCYYFNEICKIPHGSGNEKQLSDWLVAFAKERGFDVVQDELGNVVIYAPAAPGYEDHPGVILQAHMDMICEKVPGSTHDFTKDPLELYVDGTHLRARGTTLGGDDGMGVAYMLAVLDDKTLGRPALECCFTVQEEVGLIGALALKKEWFHFRRLINFDGAGEVRTYMSMGGGLRTTVHKPLTWAEDTAPAYAIHISGLLGGHPGKYIDTERANADKLAARLLYRFQLEGAALRLGDFHGGTGSVITDSAEVVFTSALPAEKLNATLEAVQKEIAEEYEFSDPDIQIVMEPAACTRTIPAATSDEIVKMLYLMPFGLKARSMAIKDLPIASINLGSVKVGEEELVAVLSPRSALDSWLYELARQVELIASLFGATVVRDRYYPGWKYEKESPLREIMKDVFQKHFGKPLACLAGHGGNECGVFKKMYPDMDIVTSGSIYVLNHTPEEYLDLESFDRTYGFLLDFLRAL